MRKSVRVLAAAVAALTLAATGCGSDPTPAPAAEPTVDLNGLDVGPYDATPRDMGKPTNPGQAAFYEAERLGSTMPLPMDIDPAFTHTGKLDTLVFLDPKTSVMKDFTDLSNFAEDAPDLISGFASYGRDDPDNLGSELVNAAMIFPTEQRATEVAAALERRDFGRDPQTQAVAIPNYPLAHAHWVPTKQAINNWYPAGRLVVFTSVYDQAKNWFNKVDLPALVSRVQKSLDTVLPALATFQPTPPDKLMDHPIDIDGMLGRTMIRPKEATGEWLNPPGVYLGRAGLHFSSDPGESRVWYDRDGVDRFADYGNEVYRARDTAAAADVRDELGGAEKHFKQAAAPRNLPVAKCREYNGKEKLAVRFYCSVYYGRYASLAWGEQLLDAQQRISAQYTILVKADPK
ncbi:DUF7373 family lipoprotein [Nocardia mikamii]|uniref:DUF7373 family lipoprotein n=1 Tax=Nocardia mikamii TaxID=508464 RepID=UPI0007A4BF8E|nr:hypothetical protein [Nocardia mikamii]